MRSGQFLRFIFLGNQRKKVEKRKDMNAVPLLKLKLDVIFFGAFYALLRVSQGERTQPPYGPLSCLVSAQFNFQKSQAHILNREILS